MSPYILLSLSSLFWSFNFIIGKLVTGAIPPITISFFRWSLPLLFYLLYSWRDIKENRKIYQKHWMLILALGTTGYCLNSITVYEAVIFTSTINTSFINAFNPALIALIGFVFCRYPIAGMQIIGFVLSLTGVLWIVFKGNPALFLTLKINIGDLMMIGSILNWSIHTILYKRYANLFPTQSLFTMMMMAGVIVTIPLVILENLALGTGWVFEVESRHVLGIICLNIFPSVLAYRFWNQALDRVPANKVAVFQYLIPVYTVIISLLFLDEHLQMFQIVGGTLIFLGVFLVANKKNEQVEEHGIKLSDK